MIRQLAVLLAGSLVAAGCVWPVPLPGQPVPTIETTVTWSAADGTVTIDVTTPDLTATVVRLFPEGPGSTSVLTDTGAPFTFTLDTATFPPGSHDMTVVATDGTTYVAEIESIRIDGCNGRRELCSRSYADVRNATTHNAMSNATDGWLGPNQNLDVPAQLAAGVRAVMLDTYRAGDLNDLGFPQVAGVDPDTAYLCHVFCALGSQPLVEGLGEIRTFLDDNPGEVVTIIVESYLGHDLTADAFDRAGLTPYAYTYPGGGWPTLGDLIDSGQRLVVMQDVAVNPTYPWLMNVWDLAFETDFSALVPSDFSCAPNRGSTTNELFILNHFLTDTFGSPDLAAQVNGNPFLLDRALECESVHSTAANFVTVDFVDIGDVQATVDRLNGS
jgi:hypothetical protein